MDGKNYYNDFCKKKECTQYIEWEYMGCGLVSCQLVGETENIAKYPPNCLFIDEIKSVFD